jgi:hypothetical protein
MASSKYKNCKTLINGHEFASKAEAKRYAELHVLNNAGVISQLKLQSKYELIPKQRRSDGTMERACHYLADFEYIENGNLIVEDVKGGKSTPEFIIKRKLMLDKYGITVREIRK